MKQLTCEMCGSTDLMKTEGVFACQTCGMKYSVEDAKKMMIEGTVEVTGTVRVDTSGNVDNLLNMAENARASGNNKEAEEYSNRVLEISPSNYMAWYIKGRAAGWQSTLAKVRFDEAIECFSNAIDNAPEDKAEEVKKNVAGEMENLTLSLIVMRCNNFAERSSKKKMQWK